MRAVIQRFSRGVVSAGMVCAWPSSPLREDRQMTAIQGQRASLARRAREPPDQADLADDGAVAGDQRAVYAASRRSCSRHYYCSSCFHCPVCFCLPVCCFVRSLFLSAREVE